MGNGPLVDANPRNYAQKDGHIHLYDDVYPLQMCILEGVQMECPRKPIKYLKKAYGKNAMIPRKLCVNSTWVHVD